MEGININNKSKEVVLYLHGCSSSPDYFKYYTQDCVDRGYDVFAPIYPGHCTDVSDMLIYGPRDWQRCARGSFELLADKYEKVHIAGHSLGGALATYIGGLYSESGKIGKILLMCPGYGLGNKEFYKTDYAKVKDSAFPFTKAEKTTENRNDTSRGYSSMHLKTVGDLIENGGTCSDMAKHITSDVTLLYAAKDPIVDVNKIETTAKEIKNLHHLYVFKNSGHNIMVDCEYKTCDRLVKFWINE